jgi:hypothetical protein
MAGIKPSTSSESSGGRIANMGSPFMKLVENKKRSCNLINLVLFNLAL